MVDYSKVEVIVRVEDGTHLNSVEVFNKMVEAFGASLVTSLVEPADPLIRMAVEHDRAFPPPPETDPEASEDVTAV